ncbi:HAMP domain-containing protein, partial [Acinetobacter baumannii]
LGNWLLGRLLAERIERTTRVAGAIAAGKLSERVPVAGLDGIFAAQAEAFNAMLDRIEDLIRNHEQFTWNVAHDLRTP